MAVATYTKLGNKSATATKLDKTIFDVEVSNHNLLKEAYVAYLANGRGNAARTKTRGLVRGGGRKPWRQKGTGRARFGSTRNPIWRGGGIVFGPTGEENYTKQLNTKAKRLAVRQALSLAAQENRIKVIESFDSKEGKAAQAMALFKKVDAQGSVLLVLANKSLLVERSTRNLPKIKTVHANYLNTYDILNADSLLFEIEALNTLSQWLGSK